MAMICRKLNSKNRILFFFIIIVPFAGCYSSGRQYAYSKAPKIVDVNENFEVTLDDGKALKLAYLRFPSRIDVRYEAAQKFFKNFINERVEYHQAKFDNGFLVYRVRIPESECFEPGCMFDNSDNLNFLLIKDGHAKFSPSVDNPERYDELKPLVEASVNKSK